MGGVELVVACDGKKKARRGEREEEGEGEVWGKRKQERKGMVRGIWDVFLLLGSYKCVATVKGAETVEKGDVRRAQNIAPEDILDVRCVKDVATVCAEVHGRNCVQTVLNVVWYRGICMQPGRWLRSEDQPTGDFKERWHGPGHPTLTTVRWHGEEWVGMQRQGSQLWHL